MESKARHACTFLLGDCLTWTAPSVRLNGPPVIQAQPDCASDSLSAAGTAYSQGCSKVCQTEGREFRAVQTVLQGRGSRDRTRVRSKGMTSTFCSAHSSCAMTYRTPQYSIGHRTVPSKVLTDIV